MGLLLKIALALFIASVGSALIIDSLTFSLAANEPKTGRAKGCYTWLEDAIGVKEPSDGLRETQMWAGVALVLGLPATLVGRTILRTQPRRR